MEYTGERCSGQVYDGSGFGRFYRCSKKAVVERDGKSYCKLHDPEYIKAKEDKKHAEGEAEWAKKRAQMELQNTAIRACKTINPANPMAVAEGITDLYEACKQALRTFEAHRIKPTDPRYLILQQAIAKVEV